MAKIIRQSLKIRMIHNDSHGDNHHYHNVNDNPKANVSLTLRMKV